MYLILKSPTVTMTALAVLVLKPRCQKNFSQENGSLGWRPGPGELGKKGDKLIQL